MSAPALEGCLDDLGRAIEAARTLGLPTETAEAVLADARRRLGFPSDAYVLALVGGTGVGKSSLLNALAGSTVSAASVRRPTTGRPVAWIPAGQRQELHGLLDWLGVGDVREHEGIDGGDGRDPLPDVAVLDLPDIDSLEPEHRRRVEEVLPRVDAVAWVSDPEKYHDAVLHDDFLRAWVRRLDRQVVVLNKADRLDGHDADQVAGDLRRDVARLAGSGTGTRAPAVLTVSAARDELDPLRRWLAAETEAKRVVRARLAASTAATADALADEAGVDPTGGARPILDAAARRSALGDATREVLSVVDLPSLERQAVAATRQRARRRGAGPLGWLTSAIYRYSGREARVADPHGYLVRWRERGSLAGAAESIRAALADPVRRAGPASRPALSAAVAPREVDAALARSLDRVVSRTPASPPSSPLWPVLGFLQTLATIVLVAAVAWTILWVLTRAPVDEVVVPVLGRVPMPFALAVGALVVGYLVAFALGLHAGWVGRRWARRLAREIEAAVGTGVSESAFAPLDRLEVARRSLWAAAREIRGRCG